MPQKSGQNLAELAKQGTGVNDTLPLDPGDGVQYGLVLKRMKKARDLIENELQ
jgi:hypothetical protein